MLSNVNNPSILACVTSAKLNNFKAGKFCTASLLPEYKVT